jgi:hypothetical protein
MTWYRKVATGWTTGVQFPAGTMMRFFVLATASSLLCNHYRGALFPRVKRPALEAYLLPPQNAEVKNACRYISFPPTQGALSPGVKLPGHEADHPPPSSGEVKNAWNYTSTLNLRLHDVVLS